MGVSVTYISETTCSEIIQEGCWGGGAGGRFVCGGWGGGGVGVDPHMARGCACVGWGPGRLYRSDSGPARGGGEMGEMSRHVHHPTPPPVAYLQCAHACQSILRSLKSSHNDPFDCNLSRTLPNKVKRNRFDLWVPY